jgi:hypothetical protein
VPRRNKDDTAVTIAGRRYDGHNVDVEHAMRQRIADMDAEYQGLLAVWW